MNWKKEIIAEMNRNRIIAIVVAVLVVVGGIVGYQYYKRTPTYTFKLIQNLVSKGYLSIVHTGAKTTYTTLTELGLKVCKSLLSIK